MLHYENSNKGSRYPFNRSEKMVDGQGDPTEFKHESAKTGHPEDVGEKNPFLVSFFMNGIKSRNNI